MFILFPQFQDFPGRRHLSRACTARRDWLQHLPLMNNANEAKFLHISWASFSCASIVGSYYFILFYCKRQNRFTDFDTLIFAFQSILSLK